MDSWIEELERLGQLRRDGVLSGEEFEVLKSRLLKISDEELDTEAVSPENGPEEVEQSEEAGEPESANETEAEDSEPATTSDMESSAEPETEPESEAEPDEEPVKQSEPTPSVEVTPPTSVHPEDATYQSAGGSKKILIFLGAVAVAAVIGLLVVLAGEGDGPASTELASLEQRIESLEVALAPTTTRAPATTTTRAPATTRAPTTRAPATTRAPTTTSSTTRAACRTAMKSVNAVLYTTDNSVFDRAFRKTLQVCGDVKTWKDAANEYGGSIRGMLSAGCILNSGTAVCRSS